MNKETGWLLTALLREIGKINPSDLADFEIDNLA